LAIDLFGIGAADPYHLLDQNWHHIAAVYSSKTGEQRLYIDGICPPGFFIHHPVGSPINDGGNLHFTYSGGFDHLVADIDEFAAYDTVLPPQLIWEHYQRGLAGLAINTTQQSSVATYPFPGPVQEGDINLLEFAPGYPNVPLGPLALFNRYPLARYSQNDSIRPLIPWMSDINPFFNFLPLAQSNLEAKIIHERLAHEWNYYLFCGGSAGDYANLRDTLTKGNPDFFVTHIIDMVNDPLNAGWPRFMVTNWGGVSQKAVLGDPNKRNQSYIGAASPPPLGSALPALADSFYVGIARWPRCCNHLGLSPMVLVVSERPLPWLGTLSWMQDWIQLGLMAKCKGS
jgi:hypothetical protein